MFHWYKSALAKRPILTQSLVSAALFGTGDVLAQQAVDRVGIRDHDYKRTGRMVLYGGAVFGPAASTWYAYMERKLVFSSRAVTLCSRVLGDQIIFTPSHLFMFLSSMALLEGKDPVEKLNSSYWKAYKANLFVWPAVQAVNFSFTPLEHRVLAVNLVSLGWNCALSLINQQS